MTCDGLACDGLACKHVRLAWGDGYASGMRSLDARLAALREEFFRNGQLLAADLLYQLMEGTNGTRS